MLNWISLFGIKIKYKYNFTILNSKFQYHSKIYYPSKYKVQTLVKTRTIGKQEQITNLQAIVQINKQNKDRNKKCFRFLVLNVFRYRKK